MVLRRANTYAFRGLAATLVLVVFYASLAARPARGWWMPASADEWRALLWPLALGLPVLPAVIAEWLDPVEADAGDQA